jgi:hypothetical protein
MRVLQSPNIGANNNDTKSAFEVQDVGNVFHRLFDDLDVVSLYALVKVGHIFLPCLCFRSRSASRQARAGGSHRGPHWTRRGQQGPQCWLLEKAPTEQLLEEMGRRWR